MIFPALNLLQLGELMENEPKNISPENIYQYSVYIGFITAYPIYPIYLIYPICAIYHCSTLRF